VTVEIGGGPEAAARAVERLKSLEGADVRMVGDSAVIYIKDGSQSIPRIVLMLSEISAQVDEVTLHRPTLDDVFLRKTGHHMEALDEPIGAGRPKP
jgi:hypothetical protein